MIVTAAIVGWSPGLANSEQQWRILSKRRSDGSISRADLTIGVGTVVDLVAESIGALV